MTDFDDLKKQVELQAGRMRKADRKRPSLLAQTRYLGTMGLLFVVPVVGGAYLGRWLDTRLPGFSVSCTLCLIILGVVTGAVNVYLFIRNLE